MLKTQLFLKTKQITVHITGPMAATGDLDTEKVQTKISLNGALSQFNNVGEKTSLQFS